MNVRGAPLGLGSSIDCPASNLAPVIRIASARPKVLVLFMCCSYCTFLFTIYSAHAKDKCHFRIKRWLFYVIPVWPWKTSRVVFPTWAPTRLFCIRVALGDRIQIEIPPVDQPSKTQSHVPDHSAAARKDPQRRACAIDKIIGTTRSGRSSPRSVRGSRTTSTSRTPVNTS